MTGEEFVLALVAIVMASAVLITGISKITGLMKSWLNRNNSAIDEENFNRLAKAFMQHKRDMEQRVQNLEAIIAENEEDNIYPEIEESGDIGTLTNDLNNNKERVRE